jgi:hypothetical protein
VLITSQSGAGLLRVNGIQLNTHYFCQTISISICYTLLSYDKAWSKIQCSILCYISCTYYTISSIMLYNPIYMPNGVLTYRKKQFSLSFENFEYPHPKSWACPWSQFLCHFSYKPLTSRVIKTKFRYKNLTWLTREIRWQVNHCRNNESEMIYTKIFYSQCSGFQ